VFETFSLEGKVRSPPANDVELYDSSDDTLLMIGKGSIPRATAMSSPHKVCAYGFACCLAKAKCRRYKRQLDQLAKLLDLSQNTGKHIARKPSQTVLQFLPPKGNLLKDLKQFRKQIADGSVCHSDPEYLWEATMQACYTSVANRLRHTVVLSGHSALFVKLDASTRGCKLQISGSILLGKPGSLLEIIKYLKFAQNQEKMSNGDVQKSEMGTGSCNACYTT